MTFLVFTSQAYSYMLCNPKDYVSYTLSILLYNYERLTECIKQVEWIEAEIKDLQKIEQELPPLRQLKLSEFKLLSRFKQERKLVKTCIILSLPRFVIPSLAGRADCRL